MRWREHRSPVCWQRTFFSADPAPDAGQPRSTCMWRRLTARSPARRPVAEASGSCRLSPPGPLLVLAGAGSGKTRALPIASLISGAASRWSACCCDFHEPGGPRSPFARLAQLGWSRSRVDRDAFVAGDIPSPGTACAARHGHRISLSDVSRFLDRGESADLLAACMDEGRGAARASVARPAQLRSTALALAQQRQTR